MTKTLRISSDLALPIDGVTQKFGFYGRTGSGKTYGATKLAEEMLAADAQVIAIDPVGVWWGLRLAADGKTPGVSIPVFGGLHGDVPLEPTAGKLVADLVVDRGISIVLDVSQFEYDAEKARFAADFADRFFFRKKSAPSAVHIFVEECQEFVPQNTQRGEERMLHVWQRLIRLGRNFGIGATLISQRPQDVNTKVRNQAECLFAFQLTGTHERKAVAEWMRDKGLDQDLVDTLPKLPIGTAHVWSPAWLEISKEVSVSPKRTFNASSTPEVGQRAQARELASIDLEQLRDAMAATIERAKADDPKLLQKRVRELEAEMAKRAKATPGPLAREIIDNAIATDRARFIRELKQIVGKELSAVSKAIARIQRHGEEWPALIVDMHRAFAGLSLSLDPAKETTEDSRAEVQVGNAKQGTGANHPSVSTAGQSSRAPARPVVTSRVDTGLSGTQMRMLQAIAFFAQIGTDEPTRAMVAGFAGISHTTGSFSNNLSALRQRGYIVDRSDNRLAITEEGAAVAGEITPPSLASLHDAWRGKLSGTQARMLDVVIAAGDRPVGRQAIADLIDVKADTGSFSNNLSKLRTLGLIADASRSEVRATDVLFPEGLR